MSLILHKYFPILAMLGSVFLLATGRVDAQATAQFRREFVEEVLVGGRDSPEHLLGPFFHGREGICADYVYIGEVFTNMRGGIDTKNATRYKGNFDLLLSADLDQMGCCPGGLLYLHADEGHGQGITESFVGDFHEVSNIDFLDVMQVTEFWWEHNLYDDSFRVRIGKILADSDFAVVDLAVDFLNGTYGTHPNIPMPGWPNASMGAVTFWRLTDSVEFKAGIWDGVTDGRTWGFSGTGVVFSAYEVKCRYDLPGARHGEFHVGLWQRSSSILEVDDSTVKVGSDGVYLGGEQMLLKEGPEDAEDQQGLGLFFQYAWANRSEASRYLGGGLVYQGLLPCRDNDRIGGGVGHTVFRDDSTETNVELFYRAQIRPYLLIQPDLQYIASPSGRYRDAFVYGLRFEIDF